MIAFIDEHRGIYGVEPICKALPAKSQSDLRGIAPSTYHEHKAPPAGAEDACYAALEATPIAA